MGKLEQIQKEIKAKYNLNVIKDVVLSRENRSIYYIEFDTINLLFKKIYGASALDKIEKSDGLHMEDIEQHFEMINKYGEIAGYDYYKSLNMNMMKNLTDECNVTFPLKIDGERVWLRFHLFVIKYDSANNPLLAACFVTDVTKYLIHEEALYEKTHKDQLTGLFNRYTLNYHFELHSHEQPLIGIYFDIDDFKIYNDTYGHSTGDEVLKLVADNLLSITNDSVTSYRLGGDEFFCLIKNGNINLAHEIIHYIQEATSKMSIDEKYVNLS